MSPRDNGSSLIPVTIPRRLCLRRVIPDYKVPPKCLVYAAVTTCFPTPVVFRDTSKGGVAPRGESLNLSERGGIVVLMGSVSISASSHLLARPCPFPVNADFAKKHSLIARRLSPRGCLS